MVITNTEIKKLIESGFDIELISFELDIPISQIKQCKAELDAKTPNNNTGTRKCQSEKELTKPRDYQTHYKIYQLRERYKRLYYGETQGVSKTTTSTQKQLSATEQLSQQDMELIINLISQIREKIQSMTKLPKKEKRKIASEILKELENIAKYDYLPMQQIEDLYILICSEQLCSLNNGKTDSITHKINNQRRKYTNQYASAIDSRISDASSLEELQELSKKITYIMARQSPMIVSPIRSKLVSKMQSIKQEQSMERIRNDIQTPIMLVIGDLANGTISIQRANEIIEQEAERIVEARPKTKFSLSKQQQIGQILIQIRTAIMERADKYPVQNPEALVMQIQELCGIDLGLALKTVVKNLISQKDFDTAKSICDEFAKKYQTDERQTILTRYIIAVKDEIRNAELGDIVIRTINSKGSPEEESKYFDLLEKGIRMGNVDLSKVSLGKNENGTRDIKLSDIWQDEKDRPKTR